MKTNHSTLLNVLNVFFWIAFIGLCIKTGALLVSFIVTLFISGSVANLYDGFDLQDLYLQDKEAYMQLVSLLIVFTGQKAYIAYLVIRFFLKFKLERPFSEAMTALFMKISHAALGAGIVALIGQGVTEWAMKTGVRVPLNWAPGEVLLFAGVIYLFALVFRKGTELQAENDLMV